MNLDREILRLSVPAIVSNLSVPLLGLSDTAISGHMDSPVYLGAIAIGSMMVNVAFWLFGFLRMGTTGLAAQAYGSGDRERAQAVFTEAFLIAMAIGLVFVVFRYPLCSLLGSLMAPEGEVREAAAGYFQTAILSAPALLATMSVIGWFLGMQTTLWPMVITISVNVCNIALSLFFVFVLDMGFRGVALGTLCANWLGLVLALVLALRFCHWHGLWVGLPVLRRKGELKRFFTVNTDILLRSACIMAVSMAVPAIGSRIGGLVLAANAVMMQFFHVFSYFMDGFAFTGEALCGRFAGSGDHGQLRRAVRHLFVWAGSFAAVLLIVYSFGAREILNLITSEAEVVAEAMRYRGVLCLIPPLTTAAFIFDGIFIGLTATRKMLIATALSAAVFFIVIAIPVPESGEWGSNVRLWTAFLSYVTLRGVILGCMAPGVMKERGPLPVKL